MDLPPLTAMRLAVTVKRARDKYRANAVREQLRELDGDSDSFGIGRIIAVLARIAVEG